MSVFNELTLMPLGFIIMIGGGLVSYIVWLITFFMEHKSLKTQVEEQGQSIQQEINLIKQKAETDTRDILSRLKGLETQNAFILSSLGRLEGILLKKQD